MVKERARQGVETLKKELRKVVLAGVGAAVLAKEGATDVARKWLAKGESVEPELRKALKQAVARRRKVADAAGKLGEKAQGGFKKMMAAIPMVTKTDVAGLARRIDALAEKVEALGRKRK